MSEPDFYDREIKRITQRVEAEGDEAIVREWYNGRGLFRWANKSGVAQQNFGCLTMIRRNFRCKAETPELTEAIRADDRLPRSMGDITLEHLPVFAEWHRRLDVELGRVPA